MSSLTIHDWLRGPASEALVDTCAKASLLFVVTALAAFLLRSRSAAVRHRLWCLGFCGALALPVLSLILPQWRLPLLPAPRVVAASPQAEQRAERPSAQQPVSGRESPPLAEREPPRITPDEPSAQALADGTHRAGGPVVSVEGSLSETAALPGSVPDSRLSPALAVPVWLLGMWLAGMLITMLPLSLGLMANWWTLKCSRHVRASHWIRLAGELATKLGLARRVTLLETRKGVMPMTWGVLRPVVLLPSESNGWNDARRRVVLLHELAHVKRLDVLFQLIARLACALYWFHPLAWYALWRLRVERELACDDCVVASGERPTDYASQLVEIARAYQPLRFSVGVAMARSTKLEQRIVAMLDQARSHLPVGRRLGRTLLASCCVLVLVLSVVGLGEKSTTSAETGNQGAEQSGPEARLARGRVVNESGQPIAHARVYAILTSHEGNTWEMRHRVVEETKADREGRFTIALPPYDPITPGERQLITRSLSLLAVADGFGPDAYAEIDRAKAADEITLTLAHDTTPLEGRVLDLEGRPVAGARVRVRSIQTTEADLDAWIAKAAHNPRSIPEDFRTRNMVQQQVAYFPVWKEMEVAGLAMFPPVLTDAEGRFQLSGLGRNRLVSLELDGAGLAKDWLHAVTRSMSPVPMPTSDPRSRSERCFGASFDYTAEPAQVISGTLRDLDSGRPIAGAMVQVHQFANSLLMVSGFVAATTDESGRYQLVGIPKPADGARPIRLEVLPTPDQPYFRTDITVSKRLDGLDPVNFDIELPRAAWVSGRMKDQLSGKPVAGYVSYYPFIENTTASAYPNFKPGLTSFGHANWYRTATDGSYRIPAIRGRGVVVARALAAPDYAIGAGADDIGWKAGQNKLIYDIYGPELTNAVREVNIEGDAATNQDVALVPLSRQRIQLLDPSGQPLTGVRVAGRRPESPLNEADAYLYQAEPQAEPSIEAIGLQADGRRLMLFSHQERKLGKAMVVDESTEVVTLQPLATLSGRVIDAAGKPVAGLYVNVLIPNSESPQSNATRAWRRRDQDLAAGPTDSEGRFHFDNILPGTKCDIAVNNQTLASRDLVGPGDVVDFGDLQLPSKQE